jgi:predicted GTPase
VTYSNLRDWYKEMRTHCEHIPCLVIANKIDMDEKVTTRRYKFIEEIGCPFNFVSAANGTNVVQIFKQALEMGLDYKANPHEDDFMNVALGLLEDKPGEQRAEGIT